MASPQADTTVRITPEMVQAMQARIGMLRRGYEANYPVTTEAHPDTIRRYAIGIGDDNPLWCDPQYGAHTRWRSVIAPPGYHVGGQQEDPPPPDRDFTPRGDPMRGLHAFNAAVETTFYRPIYPGDRCSTLMYLEDVQHKKSEFSGSTIQVTWAARTRTHRGDLVKVVRSMTIHTERGTASSRGKYRDIERATYTPEELAAIDEVYANEQRRGAEPRYWEDVEVDEEIPQIVKGPYSLTDWMGWVVGNGQFGAFGTAPMRLNYLNRQRIPRFYFADAYGVPVSAYACHFDQEVAEAAGNPMPYDVGVMREAWLNHMLTSWMGDEGFIHRTRVEFRRFNYLGDTQWCTGRVVGKRREGDLHLVEIETRCTNQRGEVTTPGSAQVLLPSREHGPVRLPDPPRDIP